MKSVFYVYQIFKNTCCFHQENKVKAKNIKEKRRTQARVALDFALLHKGREH